MHAMFECCQNKRYSKYYTLFEQSLMTHGPTCWMRYAVCDFGSTSWMRHEVTHDKPFFVKFHYLKAHTAFNHMK